MNINKARTTDYEMTFGEFLKKWLLWGAKAFFILAIILFTFLSCASLVQGGTGEDIDAKLQDYYNFNNNNLTGTSGKTFQNVDTDNITARFGSGRDFFTDDYINVSPMVIGSTNDTQFAYFQWFNMSSSTDVWTYFANKHDGTNSGFFLGLFGTTSKFACGTGGRNSSDASNMADTTLIYNSSITDGQFHLFGIWRNSSNVCCYLNGAVNCTTNNNLYLNTNKLLTIGARNDASKSNSYFDGVLDEAYFFNQSLTKTEADYIYNSSYGRTYPFTAPGTPINYTPVFQSQIPSDITTLNVINIGFNASYNYSQTHYNISSIYLNYTVIGGSTFINGTAQSAYQQKAYKYNVTNNYTFHLDDNEVFPGVYNMNEQTMEDTIHMNLTISNSNTYYKVNLLGINTSKTYSFLEAMLSTTGNARIYYCNSSYSTGNIGINANCVLFGSTSDNFYNHTHNNSQHNVFSMPIINGTLGGVIVTSNSSFAITSFTGNAYLGYVNTTVRSDSVRYTNNNGNTWSNMGNTMTIDAHAHQYDASESLYYQACGYNTSNSLLCSSFRSDAFDIAIINPTSTNVQTNKDSYYYTENVIINTTNSSAFNGYIYGYTYLLYNSSNSLKKTILTLQNTTNASFIASNLSPDYYYVVVRSTDNNSLYTDSRSSSFHVGSNYTGDCDTTITLNSTGASVTFSWSTDTQISTTTLKGYLGIIDTTFTTTNPTTYSFNSSAWNDNTYNLYLAQDIESDTGCYLDMCENNYERTPQPCTNDLRLINYTDTNTCPVRYDEPSDIGTYEDCVTPANTDRELWFLLLLIIVWIFSIIACVLWSPLIIVVSFPLSIFIGYLSIDYFTSPLLGFVLATFSAFILVVAIRLRR
jgi:hypothetical protein